MNILLFLSISIIVTIKCSAQLQNLLDTELHNCIKCLCHARTGCESRFNCASYSIDMDYWRRAGSPTLNVGDPANVQSYMACMRNENCILNTIKLYTDSFQQPNCDCNDVYDCRDMLMLHLKGESCKQEISNRYRERYDACAGRFDMPRIGTVRCIPEAS